MTCGLDPCKEKIRIRTLFIMVREKGPLIIQIDIWCVRSVEKGGKRKGDVYL